MSSPQSNSPFDSRMLLTMVLVGAAWFAWQSYLSKTYPQTPQQSISIQGQSNQQSPNAVTPSASSDAANAKSASSGAQQDREVLTHFSDANWSFDLSSKGMALKNVKLAAFSDRSGRNITFGEDDRSLFGSSLYKTNDPIQFQIKQTGPETFVGEASVDGAQVTKTVQVDSGHFAVKTNILVKNTSAKFAGLTATFNEKITPAASGGSFFSGRFDHQEFYVNHDNSTTRTVVAPDKPVTETFAKTLIAGFGSQYFAIGLLDTSDVIPELKIITKPGAHAELDAYLNYEALNKSGDFKIGYTGFAGPKSFELLKEINPELTGLINFGFFTSIAKVIFSLMKGIQAIVGNWGFAIIVLTLIVRLIVMPFNILSYKQMKAMSKIQPQIKLLRERYKNDSAKLNQEMLGLMRESKANPLGGCLPMFLQIPIFFALYQVIGQSIELYKQPFGFWLHDLSAKDPYFVIPVLMGLAMFTQQKITPNTMDPSQQKVMQFMPIIFTAMMLSLPSGLTLYILISSVFGLLQQYFFTRENKKDQLTVVPA